MKKSTWSEAQAVIVDFGTVTEDQFEVWVKAMNEAVARMGGTRIFTQEDTDKAISYWYVFGALFAHTELEDNPFQIKKDDTRFSKPAVSMAQLYEIFAKKFQPETVRRYVGDLRRCKLLDQVGRGESASIAISLQAISALALTVRHWTREFRKLDARIRRIDAA